MFQIHKEKDSLVIRKDVETMMQVNKCSVALEQFGNVELHQIDCKIFKQKDELGKYTAYEYMFSDEEDEINFSLMVHCYENFIKAFVKVNIKHERTFSRNKYLTAEDSIVISIKQLGNVEGLLAHYLHKDWWTRPHFNAELSTIPPRTQSLLWKISDCYYYFLPFTEDHFKTELRGVEEGIEVVISSYDTGWSQCDIPIFVIGYHDSPFSVTKQVTSVVQNECGGSRLINERIYPSQFEYLGWCSWDAFYHEVNEQGMIDKAKELQEKGVPIKWMLIDDGWSMTNELRLASFSEDPEKFPSGFRQLTKDLKGTYDIRSVGVWHTFAGYWGGIDPDSPLAQEMAAYLYQTNSQKLIPYPDKSIGFGFWDTWHAYLKSQGIDFVKVDGQSAINNFMMYEMSVGKSSKESHKALEASVGNHFDHEMINCMGMAQENIWNRPLSAISRTSDDFVPNEVDSFPEHALQNVYNSFYHGELYWGDWDMFWTQHIDATRHAVLRAVSGGPIYISDRVGETDHRALLPLVYENGKIIRCEQPGKPSEDILMKDPITENVLLKVQNISNHSGVLAVFNINKFDNEILGSISPNDIQGLTHQKYYVYNYFNRTIELMLRDQVKEISLSKDEFGLYLFLPKQYSVTPIGLINKYISSSTVDRLYSTENEHSFKVKDYGEFAFIAESKPKNVFINGQKVSVRKLLEDSKVYVVEWFKTESNIIHIYL